MIASSFVPAPAAVPPMSSAPTVRPATAADDQWIEELQAIAFGPGRFARTAYRVRERFPIDKSLSLVAEVDGIPCGSVWMTPVSVAGLDGYMLGPLATHPNFRRRGAGKLLATEVTKRALARPGISFSLLVGDRDYYMPLGYQATTEGAIVFPGPVDPTRVLLQSNDPALALRLAGPIEAFGTRFEAE
jgi:predicted N-acetyltransferase YhbS